MATDLSAGSRRSLTAARIAAPSPAAWVALATVVSIAITVWWALEDARVPSWDPAAHIYRSLEFADAFRAGDLTHWFTSFQTPGYPPLVYLLGALVSLTVGEGVAQFVIAQNVVFLPLLALGTYQAGKVAYGPRAGAFAAIFALGAPIVVTQSHVFMLDLPGTAMAAVAVWLILASRRFARPDIAMAAGAAVGLGMLTKNTFVFFVVGIVVVVLLRGGWRHRRGIGAFVLGALLTGVPWYLWNFEGLFSYATGGPVAGASIYGDPPNLAIHDWLWYLWDAVNVQLYLPLTLFALAGVVWGVVRMIRRRPWDPADLTPELFGGLVPAWILVTALSHNDVRYNLQALVYGAVLGTAWFATSDRRALRNTAAAVLVAVCAVNVVSSSTGRGIDLSVTIGGPWQTDNAGPSAGRFTVFSTAGWLVAGPERSGDLEATLRAAREQGATYVAIDRVKADVHEFPASGLTVLARFAGLEVAPGNDYAALGPRDVFVTRGQTTAPPCGRLPTGEGIYLSRGSDLQPLRSADNLVCPPRSAQTYGTGVPPRIDAEAQAALEAELRAAARQGRREVYFQESVISTDRFGGAARLRGLGERAGLRPPEGGLASSIGDDGVTVLSLPKGNPSLPARCVPLPDGGLLLLRGQLTESIGWATNLYCPTRSASTYRAPLAG